MRVLPISLNWQMESQSEIENGLISLLVLRRLLVSGVAANGVVSTINNEIKLAAVAAGPDPSRALTGSRNPNAVNTIATVHYSGAAEKAAFVSTYSVRNPECGWSGWDLVQSECAALKRKDLLENIKLWAGIKNPLHEEWTQLKGQLQQDTVDWSFWITWYEAVLKGEPLNWTTLERIALMSSEDWEQGPKHVNGLIAAIVTKFKGQASDRFGQATTKPLSQKDSMVLMTADGMSAHINSVIERYHSDTGINQLPEEFRILEELPPIFGRISQIALSGVASNNSLLDREITELRVKIEELEADLKVAKEKSVSGVFSKAFLEQAGKSLGDWKMWGALGSAAYFFASVSASSGAVTTWSSISGITNSIREIFPHKP